MHDHNFLTVVPDENYDIAMDPALVGQVGPKVYAGYGGMRNFRGEVWLLDGADHKHIMVGPEATGNFDDTHADYPHGHATIWLSGAFQQSHWGQGADHQHTIHPYPSNTERLHPAFWMVNYQCDQADYDLLMGEGVIELAKFTKENDPVSSEQKWSQFPEDITWDGTFQTQVHNYHRNQLGMDLPTPVNSGFRWATYFGQFVKR